MRPRKRFFIKAIAQKIRDDVLFSKETDSSLSHIPIIAIGDVDLISSPEYLENTELISTFFPAILITPRRVYYNETSGNKSISKGEYYYTIRYAHYYGEDESFTKYEDALDMAELIAEHLLEDKKIDSTPEFTKLDTYPHYVELKDPETNIPIGQILSSSVPILEVNSFETEFFKSLRIPLVIVDIEYQVLFRSYYKPDI